LNCGHNDIKNNSKHDGFQVQEFSRDPGANTHLQKGRCMQRLIGMTMDVFVNELRKTTTMMVMFDDLTFRFSTGHSCARGPTFFFLSSNPNTVPIRVQTS